MQAIQNIQLQLQTLSQSITQDKDRRQMLDRLVAEAEALPPIAGSDAGHGTGGRQEEESRCRRRSSWRRPARSFVRSSSG